MTVTTVGYGDQTPKTVFQKTFVASWMLFGLVLMAGLLDTVANMVLNDQDVHAAEVRSTTYAELDKLDEHVEVLSRQIGDHKEVGCFDVTTNVLDLLSTY